MKKVQQRPGSRREAVLDAAAHIVERDGAAHLTIDAVAAEADLSKGGVLYHFPSKRALLSGMLSRLLNDFQARLAPADEHGPSAVAAWIKAEYEQTPRERSMALALLANAAEDPSLLDPARSFVRESMDRIRIDGSDGQLNLILMLAAEGVRFLEMLGMLELDTSERLELNDRLLRLADQAH